MRSTAPKANELELSLFGPGIGECIVVHVGAGDWMVVDSCLSETKKPVALEYLQSIGVDVEKQVKLVAATHWHDDHIRGMAQLMRYADAAKFACSSALKSDEFVALLELEDELKFIDQSSGVSELADILDILDSRVGDGLRAGPDHWASQHTLLYSATHPAPVDVYSLSPSSQTITDAKMELASLLSDAKRLRRVPAPSPNDLAVAILIRFENMQFLLGADLATGKDARRGWQAVVASRQLLGVKGGVYKVSHHGSHTGDLAEIWEQLLTQQPFAVIAPYARGQRPLPSPDDVSRLKQRTNRLYCTVWPATRSPHRRVAAVGKTLKELGYYRREYRKRPGHIRLRAPMTGTPDTIVAELLDGATQL